MWCWGRGEISNPSTLHWLRSAALIAVASVGGLCRTAKRGAHGTLAGTDGAGNTLAADNLYTGLARVQIVDMTLAVTFRAGFLGARPRQARLPQRRRHRRCSVRYPRTVAGHGPRRADCTHSTPPNRADATRNHIGKNPLRLGRGRPLIATDGRMAAWFSIGTLSLHVAQYAPCERISRKPRTPRRSLITVSDIVGPPHRLHSIAMSRLRLSFSTADIKRSLEHIKNNNCRVQGGPSSGRSGDVRVRTIRYHHRLRRRPPTRRTDLDSDHQEHGAMAAASANECSAADALVAEGRAFDAESTSRRRERYARPGPCRRRTMGLPSVSASGLSTPTFWTVSMASLLKGLLWKGHSSRPCDFPKLRPMGRCKHGSD
jgi:hypothetical protein